MRRIKIEVEAFILMCLFVRRVQLRTGSAESVGNDKNVRFYAKYPVENSVEYVGCNCDVIYLQSFCVFYKYTILSKGTVKKR